MSAIMYAYNRFCTERFPLPTEAQVAELERRIHVTFPDEYRKFLLEFNGGYFDDPSIMPVVEGCPREALFELHGIGASHETAELGSPLDMGLYDDNDPPIILPIGATPLGGLILLVTEQEGFGEILYEQAYGPSWYLADGIEEFFELLHTSPDS
jgi:SMI1-KNR4 cell-wall